MDEIKQTQLRARGTSAQILLDDELFIETMDALKKEYLDYWSRTHVNDVNGRERLWQAYQIVGKVREHLGKIAAAGRLASKDLSSIKTLKR